MSYYSPESEIRKTDVERLEHEAANLSAGGSTVLVAIPREVISLLADLCAAEWDRRQER